MRHAERIERSAAERVPGADAGKRTPHPPSAGTGRALDPVVRRELEHGLGHSFAEVRIHADPAGDATARAWGARAMTMGADVFFQEGEYQPASAAGLELLAHELAHVVQHGHGGAAPPWLVSEAQDPAEAEARSAAAAVRAGGQASIVGSATAVVARSEEEKSPGAIAGTIGTLLGFPRKAGLDRAFGGDWGRAFGPHLGPRDDGQR